MNILISPWAKELPNGKPNPKNYPWWPEIVKGLSTGHNTTQLGLGQEKDIGCSQRKNNLALKELEKEIQACDLWVSVDSFFQHLAWSLRKPGIVLFGPSDPLIFGHSENINLLKSRGYLRTNQFLFWTMEEYMPERFVSPDVVLKAISKCNNYGN